MKAFIQFVSVSLAAIVVFIGIVAVGNPAAAQTAVPQILLTWRAANYAPPSYRGKLLPVRATPVTAALEVVDNGAIADLSQREIRWFVNNQLLISGKGRKTAAFSIAELDAGDTTLKAVVMGYRGRDIEKSAVVPVVEPQVIIDSPYPGGEISPQLHTVRALSYFFNASTLTDLMFVWTVNGRSAMGNGENPNELTLDASAGKANDTLTLLVRAAHKTRPLEFTNASLSLILH